MRKSYIFFTFIFFLLSLLSCGGGSTNKEYTISFTNDSNYQISNLEEKAQNGKYIEFIVKSTNIFYQVEEVLMNNQPFEGNQENYSFTMPSENVTIKVEMSKVDEYENGNISFSNKNSSTISKVNDEVSVPIHQELIIEFNDKASKYITTIVSEILIENENIIPSDAITYNNIYNTSSNIIKGGKLIINLNKVKVGETLIYLNLKPNNGSLGTIIKKIKVVEYGEIELETMKVNFTFTNNSSYNIDKLFINIIDLNFVYGSNTIEFKSFYLKDLKNQSYTFDYIIGHQYNIFCGTLGGKDVNLAQWVGEGSTLSGFNYFQDNILNLITPNIEVPFIIQN